MTTVMLFGTFNMVHKGHEHLFKQASAYGDNIVVVLARDETIKKLKHYDPKPEEERKEKLLSVPEVDSVVLGSLTDKMSAVREIKPDVICLGYDQEFYVDVLEKFIADEGLAIKVARLKPFLPEQYKTSILEGRA